ncbi:hypothetical protein BCV69DRAFT_284787 [Microstroma glucosiphilum]|uniref:Uncharacterized protein n=1 Tax=Pseudomicrostroma glucosiphilum TaxID=1684307 RepID=A0A316U1U5_9BASI|nr:hypothetical protein BCV69DRAFT_284787 [Pseudomicrostroma glucosiphilum]PWN18804.1 hypothetical protein BCV69DRAFT_284787 [Pseudomicrostroma glucosiphilum]
MFLPRTASTTSLSTLSSFRTTDTHARPILPGSSIGWSNATTASSTINVSAQVHYSLLASRYRLLSAQKGLGIAAGAQGLVEQDLSGRTRGEGSSTGNSAGGPSDQAKKAATANLQNLFAGTRARATSSASQAGPSSVPLTAVQTSDSARDFAGSTGRSAASHSGRHGSTRSYAKERLKVQEVTEEVIEAATDTGRLKWEAKAALLSASPSLALLLLIRAATLGSVSACISLSALYTTGVSRGVEPPVTLVYREPLAALAWALEAVRLLRRRMEKVRRSDGGSGQRTRVAQKQTQEKDALDQVAKILALIERLLRTKEVAADLGRSGADRAGTTDGDIRLPDLRRLQARGRKRTTETFAEGLVDPASETFPQLWPSMLEARLWLEAELSFLTESRYPQSDASNRGPDDESADELPALIHVARVHVAIVKALALTYSICKVGVLEDKTIPSLRSAWKLGETDGLPITVTDEIRQVVATADGLIQELQDGAVEGETKTVQEAGRRLWERLDKTLPESVVPVLEHVETRSTARPNPQMSLQTTARGRNIPTLRSTKQRRRSLETLAPVTAEDARAQQPVLLRAPTSPAKDRSSSVAVDPTISVPGRFVNLPSTSSSHRLRTRTISYAGPNSKPSESLLSAPTKVSSRSTKLGRTSELEGPSPSYLHHFGAPAGPADKQLVRRPSSVMSDSPSLLFGDQGEDPLEPLVSLGLPSSSRRGGGNPEQRRTTDPTALTSRRGTVTSLYGEPSVTTQTVTTSGTSSTAYGHVDSSGLFDPTASLRETQVRRRRADSSATVATGVSIRSMRAIHDVSRDEEPLDDRSDLGKPVQVEQPVARAPQSGFRLPRFPSIRSLSDSLVPTALRTDGKEKENVDASAPLLTERLERKLAESYAAQQRSTSGGKVPQMRRQDSSQSLASHFSTTSRRTGLASLRAPSFYPATGQGRGVAPSLAFLPPGRLVTGATLATTAENAELGPSSMRNKPTTAVGNGSGSGSVRQASGKGASALSTLRALRTNTSVPVAAVASTHTDSAVPAGVASNKGHEQTSQHASRGSRAFAGIDPTSRKTYATGNSNGASSAGHSTPASPSRPSAASITAIKSPLSGASPPTSPRPPSDRTSSHRSCDVLDPALAEAEEASRLKTTTGCHLCGVRCVNAPLDRKGRKFCSRTCRVEMKKREKAEDGSSSTASSSSQAAHVSSLVSAKS